ncbi:hypothetical protein RCH10_005084 [Variovorax sp. GrIS 2.14]
MDDCLPSLHRPAPASDTSTGASLSSAFAVSDAVHARFFQWISSPNMFDAAGTEFPPVGDGEALRLRGNCTAFI